MPRSGLWPSSGGPHSSTCIDMLTRSMAACKALRHQTFQVQEALLDVVWGLDEQALPGCAVGLGDMVSYPGCPPRHIGHLGACGTAALL